MTDPEPTTDRRQPTESREVTSRITAEQIINAVHTAPAEMVVGEANLLLQEALRTESTTQATLKEDKSATSMARRTTSPNPDDSVPIWTRNV